LALPIDGGVKVVDEMDRTTRLLIYIAFFISGAAGLIYQVAWSRYLSLMLGSTGLANIIVLSTFMGGLGIGAWWFGRIADRSRSCLMLFVILELAIVAYGAMFPFAFPALQSLFHALTFGHEPGSMFVTVVKVLVAISAIIVPTILMGGTLPVLSKFLIHELASVGHRVSQLYYINSLGAVAGTFLAGFFLIGKLGLTWTMLTGALFDLVTALVVLAQRDRPGLDERAHAVVKSKPKLKGKPKPEVKVSQGSAEVYPARLGTIALAVIGVSGAVSMIYEVAWIRMLALVLGSSIYSFALMVGTFIAGITLGSFLLSFKKTDREYYPLLGYLEILVGLTLLFSLPIYMHLPYLFNQMQGVLRRADMAFPLYHALQVGICFCVMIVPTLFIGMTLPTASKIATTELRSLGGRIGATFAINTFGTIFGTVIGGAILMPKLGIKGALLTGMTLNLILGFWILLTAPRSPMTRRLGLRLTAVVALTATGLLMMHLSWNDRILLRSVFREAKPFESAEEYANHVNFGTLLYHVDGMDATVAVMAFDDNKYRTLYLNGKPDASVSLVADEPSGDMPQQLMAAHLPMLFHPGDPKDILVVGQGSGVSAGAAAAYKGSQVDMVELSREIAETAHFFAPANRDFHKLPNVRHIVEDGRTHLALTQREYDVIVNVPSNPWMAGNASLFTREYFAACAARLRPDGLMLQWVQCYEMDNASLRMILGTFRDTFPYMSLWELATGDLAMLGSREPLEPNFEVLQARLLLPNVAKDLAVVGMDLPETLLSMQILDMMTTGDDFIGKVALNSEFTPFLEYNAPRAFFARAWASDVEELDTRTNDLYNGMLWQNRFERSADASTISAEQWRRNWASAYDRHDRHPNVARAILRAWQQQYPGDPAAVLAEFDTNRLDEEEPTRAEAQTLRGPSLAPLHDKPAFQRTALRAHDGVLLGLAMDVEDELGQWEEWLKLLAKHDTIYRWWVYEMLGRIARTQGRHADALVALRQCVELIENDDRLKDPAALRVMVAPRLIVALLEAGELADANRELEAYAATPSHSHLELTLMRHMLDEKLHP